MTTTKNCSTGCGRLACRNQNSRLTVSRQLSGRRKDMASKLVTYDQERKNFQEKYRHEIMGLVVDGCTTGRTGAPLAAWLRQTMQKIDQRLADIFQELRPDQPVSQSQQKGKAS